MGLGNAGAQVINLITIPVITRLYPPESYGVLGLFLSFSAFLIAVSCLRFEFVILLPEKDNDAGGALLLCIFFVFIFSITIACFGFLFNLFDFNAHSGIIGSLKHNWEDRI